ncbi:rCG56279 [Rattus norvegicus]|uniref:RCG56279 n=1 Tax=Rattus norvegicus TaxID=10116 RepID=A6IAX8_RAT|nr:rCG56279 [Rattus norvegicus]
MLSLRRRGIHELVHFYSIRSPTGAHSRPQPKLLDPHQVVEGKAGRKSVMHPVGNRPCFLKCSFPT